MQIEVVITRSTSNVAITGPAPAAPSKAKIRGTPMKPELGKLATSAPMATSGQPAPRARASQKASAITTAPQISHSAATAGLNRAVAGVVLPKRNSMHGSAKYRTKVLSPGTASSGSTRSRAAK